MKKVLWTAIAVLVLFIGCEDIIPEGESPVKDIVPSAPSNVEMTATGNSIDVKWSASIDDSAVAGYYVSWKVADSETWGSEEFEKSTSYTISGLVFNTRYDVRIRARDDADQYSDYATAQTTTTAGGPSVPGGIQTTQSAASLSVSWQASSGQNAVVEYYVSWKKSSDSDWGAEAAVTEMQYTIVNLMLDVEYSIRVRAKDSTDKFSEYGMHSATLADNPPSAPGSITIVPSSNSLSLSWDEAADDFSVAGYYVSWKASSEADWGQEVTTSETSYVIGSLLTNVGFDVRVRAKDSAGNYGPYASNSATTVDNAPTQPGAVNAQSGGTSLDVSWDASTDDVAVAGYAVSWKPNGGSWSDEVSVTATTYTITGLNPNTKYDIRVRAKDDENQFSPYAYASKSTVDNAPTQPGAVNAQSGGTSLDVSWDASTDDVAVAGYAVSWKPNGGSWSDEVSVTATTYTITGLNPNTKYDIRVRAKDDEAQFSPYAYASKSTVDNPPTAPGQINVTPSSESLFLSWEASTDDVSVAGYAVSWKVSGGSDWGAEVESAATSYSISSLLANTSYDVRVRAKDSSNQYSDYSQGTAKTDFDTNPHSGNVRSVVWSKDGTVMVTGSDDKTVKVRDSSGYVQKTFSGHSGAVHSVAISSDKGYAVSGSTDDTVKVWDIATGSLVRTLSGHTDDVYAVDISLDGSRVVSGSKDNTIKIWNLATGALLRSLSHTEDVTSVAFSPDGTKIASASYDDKVNIWDSGIYTLLQSFTLRDASAVAWSPDSTMVAAGGTYSEGRGTTNDPYHYPIKIWNVNTGNLERTLYGHNSHVHSLAWSADGTKLASGSLDNTIKLWDVNTGAELHRLSDGGKSSADVLALAWYSDDAAIAAGGKGSKIVCAVGTGIKIREYGDGQDGTVSTTVTDGHAGTVRSVRWDAVGKVLVSASDDDTVKLWSGSGALQKTLLGHTGNVRGAAARHPYVVSGGEDNTVKVWDLNTNSLSMTLRGHTDYIYAVDISPDGTRAASGDTDGSIKIWNLATGALERSFSHTSVVNEVVYSPDGTKIASASSDDKVNIWDSSTGALLQSFPLFFAYTVAWSPDSTMVAAGGRYRLGSGYSSDPYHYPVKIWQTALGVEERTLYGHNSYVYSLAWSADGTKLASGSQDDTIKLWDTSTGAELHRLADGGKNSADVLALAWYSDDAAIAAGDKGSKIVCAAGTGIKIREYGDGQDGTVSATVTDGHAGTVRSVRWDSVGKVLVSASDDGTVKLWTSNGLLQKTLLGHTAAVRGAAARHPYVVSGSEDHTVKVWDMNTNSLSMTLRGHTIYVYTVDISPDGTRAVSGDKDGSIKIWNLATGALERSLSHTDDVSEVAFSPDGTKIASASYYDDKVNIWDSSTGTLLQSFSLSSAYTVAWSPDSSMVAAGGGYREGRGTTSDPYHYPIKIWNVNTGNLERKLFGPNNTVYSLAWSTDGSKVVSGSRYGDIKFWNASTGTELKSVNKASDIRSLDWIKTATEDKAVYASGSGIGFVEP